jgi:hydroxyacylglutathione hydrolase
MMLLTYFYDRSLAQASYLVGCAATGEALVIDPSRDIRPYLQTAAQEGLRITHITETHIHADFVSGLRELAAATRAVMYVSDMGDASWKYAFADSPGVVRLQDGDTWMVGNIRVQAIHTPGHTPEHLIFQMTDTAGADRPMGLFTGDLLFVGTIGRPDLLEKAAGVTGTAVVGARQQFANIERLREMPDYLQVWPGHGAGSACGKGLGAIPSTTLGYEKLFNPAFHIPTEEAFVAWLLEGQPEAPRYFGQMKRVNRQGAALLSTLPQPIHLPSADLPARAADSLVIDTRPLEAFARQHAPGTVNIPADSSSLNTYVGWYVDFAAPTYLVADPADLPRILQLLRAVGVDDIPGYFAPDALTSHTGTIQMVTPRTAQMLMRDQGAFLLDVRGADEFASRHIPGAAHIPMGYVPAQRHVLPTDVPLIVQCGGGTRSQVVASLLQREGFTNVLNLAGGIDGWEREGLPLA